MCQYSVFPRSFEKCKLEVKHVMYLQRRVDWNPLTHQDENGNLLSDPCPNNKLGTGETKMCAFATEVTGQGSGGSGGSSRSGQGKLCPICVMEENSDWRYSGSKKFIINAPGAGDDLPNPNFFDCLKD